MPPLRILQANLNHSARAQDLFVHCLAELGVGLAVAAEPYRVADRPNWVADALGFVVIVGDDTAALRVFARGDGFVGAECGGLALIVVYAPPSAPPRGVRVAAGRGPGRIVPLSSSPNARAGRLQRQVHGVGWPSNGREGSGSAGVGGER
ncbi:uncharacterized protein LOC128882394 [Hylaeus volcanicus]|uniref:uncharacterized protein LOC128882394 n=1 Tax=Hylaeus volcanicus TaxID=313075 RepID=UPI0023B807E5|nr:uncharacterized protein LOC128882394 [Hylaeus volcanicus]